VFSRDKQKSAADNAKISTIVGEEMTVEGCIRGAGSVRIDGNLQGAIDIEGDIIVGESGKAGEEIVAQNAKIAGVIDGDLKCSGTVELTSTSTVNGDISSEKLIVDRGAVFNGVSHMAADAEDTGIGGEDVNTDKSNEASEN